MNEDETPSTADEIRALADEAEAEAAEAEALAAAARARARAIQLRRQAAQAAAKKEDASAQKDDAAGSVETEAEATREDEPEEEPTREAQPEEAESAEVRETAAETEESPAEAVAAPDADTEADKPARRLRRLLRPQWSTLAASVAILVIVAALAGSGYMIKEHREAVQRRQRVAEFAAAARQGVITLTSLDFNNAKQGVQRILDNSTGSFRDDFVKMADDFTQVVEKSKVISQGTVQAVAVELDSMTKDSAVALVASTSEVTNAAGAKQDPRNYRLIVTVTRDGDQLKISKVEFVP